MHPAAGKTTRHCIHLDTPKIRAVVAVHAVGAVARAASTSTPIEVGLDPQNRNLNVRSIQPHINASVSRFVDSCSTLRGNSCMQTSPNAEQQAVWVERRDLSCMLLMCVQAPLYADARSLSWTQSFALLHSTVVV